MRLVICLLFIVSFLIISYTPYTNKPDQVQIGVPKIIQTIRKGEYSYSVQQTPFELIKYGVKNERYFIESVSSIVVKKKKEIIQEFKLEDETDLLTVSFEKKFFPKEFGTLLKVKFEWNHYTTMSEGYIGYVLYAIDTTGKITTKVFSWFEDCGGEDAPHAELLKFKILGSNIIINYKYYEKSGYPELGKGTFTVTYGLNKVKKTIELVRIESQVYRTERFIGLTPNHNNITEPVVNPPELIPLSKEYLNERLEGKYSLIF